MLTVVTGPPCSGKTTHVREHSEPGDIVIDFDDLAQALGSPERHGHAEHVMRVTVAARSAAIREAIKCHQRGGRVWIVDGTPTDRRLVQYRDAVAEIVRLSADPVELHRRASAERPQRWHDLIDQWLESGGKSQPVPWANESPRRRRSWRAPAVGRVW